MRRFLKFELDSYLGARGSERAEELPLERVEASQGYIHYRKGSLVMYLLKQRMGEAAVNRALRRVLTQYRFEGAPYPMSTALIAALRAEATPDVQPLIADLFERITLWDLKATAPKVSRRADGRFDVAVTVVAHKFYANGQGKQTETPLDERVDIGLFTAEPGRAAFNDKSVIALEPRRIRSGTQRLTFTEPTAPAWVGVDPYNTHIDRNFDDNLIAVTK
jgi:ABC-2 type transport system permease protein